uniref:Uncharacterized protein n=1 Tax=Anopheles coluzzii TaxID=1518534 RepID=A0A8W7PLE1_ANOCL
MYTIRHMQQIDLDRSRPKTVKYASHRSLWLSSRISFLTVTDEPAGLVAPDRLPLLSCAASDASSAGRNVSEGASDSDSGSCAVRGRSSSSFPSDPYEECLEWVDLASSSSCSASLDGSSGLWEGTVAPAPVAAATAAAAAAAMAAAKRCCTEGTPSGGCRTHTPLMMASAASFLAAAATEEGMLETAVPAAGFLFVLGVILVVVVALALERRWHGQVEAAHLLADALVECRQVGLTARHESTPDQCGQIGGRCGGGEVGRVGQRHAAQSQPLLLDLHQPLAEQDAELYRIEGCSGLVFARRDRFRGLPVRDLLLQAHPVVVEPVGDGAGGQAELAGQEFDCLHVGVRVEGERESQRFLLLFGEQYALLLVGWSRLRPDRPRAGRVGVIELGRVVARGVAAIVLSSRAGRSTPLAGFAPLVLQYLQSLDVVGVAQPQLHANERLAALDAQHVPGLRFGQQLGNGPLRQPEHGLAEDFLADVVRQQCLLDLGRDHLRVEILRERRHLVHRRGDVLVERAAHRVGCARLGRVLTHGSGRTLRDGRVDRHHDGGLLVRRAGMALQSDGMLGRNARRRQEHRLGRGLLRSLLCGGVLRAAHGTERRWLRGGGGGGGRLLGRVALDFLHLGRVMGGGCGGSCSGQLMLMLGGRGGLGSLRVGQLLLHLRDLQLEQRFLLILLQLADRVAQHLRHRGGHLLRQVHAGQLGRTAVVARAHQLLRRDLVLAGD